ncbi:Crp/Fnr family transcriptional regulator [Pararhizobium antarcticum]|uniref:Transcriptional regulator n=1 Tax=Pararhizobium antarcticum TaxID=1798805 RepID=A0A657LS54_9HYPH|nr:Crp/Fnr family transcriptional regulator [Pararhizobium antarcticum]OJF92749.1 transcriptional regulator [Rhizobium sp. 58]OJF95111.1 transcriptional regulator [Pararhizobium antarcticum]
MSERKDVQPSGVPVPCLTCDARSGGVCGTLDAEQLASLAKASSKKRLESGAELIGDAQTVEAYSNILSGVVKLTKGLPDGREQIVGLQFAPDFLGRPFQDESAITAHAATNVVLCSFPKRTLEMLIKQSPRLEHFLLNQTLRELDEARDWMLTLGRKNALEKVASYLLLIARYIDPAVDPDSQSIAFDLPMSRLEIADFLGLTIETVSRQLTKLRIDGVIAVSQNRHIVVANPERLRMRSGC